MKQVNRVAKAAETWVSQTWGFLMASSHWLFPLSVVCGSGCNVLCIPATTQASLLVPVLSISCTLYCGQFQL